MEIWRSDDPDFQKFGQAYITWVYPGVVKAWHYHKKQTDNFVCVSGMAKVALHDAREGSPTKGETNDFVIGWQRQRLLDHPARRLPRFHRGRYRAGGYPQHSHRTLRLRGSGRVPPPVGRSRDRLRLGGEERMKILVCGGAGFIGSNFIRRVLAGRPAARGRQPGQAHLRGQSRQPAEVEADPRYRFIQADICDGRP